MNKLQNYATRELVDELKRREGVESITSEPYEQYEISVGKGESAKDAGPAVILVIRD